MDHFCYSCFMSVFVILSCLFLAALYSPGIGQLGKGWPVGSLVCCVFLCFCEFQIFIVIHTRKRVR